MPIFGEQALPQEIIDAIAIANARSIGEQPAILANLALASQIMNTNLQQQMLLTQQQAMNQIMMATVARCVSLITTGELQPQAIQNISETIHQLTQIMTSFQESSRELLNANLASMKAAAAAAQPSA